MPGEREYCPTVRGPSLKKALGQHHLTDGSLCRPLIHFLEPAGQQGDQQPVDQVILADQDFADLGLDLTQGERVALDLAGDLARRRCSFRLHGAGRGCNASAMKKMPRFQRFAGGARQIGRRARRG